MKAKTNYRYRLTFGKGRRVKYVAHLDTVITWTRAFRRAHIPLAYSQGYNPHARIQVAASLPLGYMGRSEIMDIYLNEPMDATEILSSVGNTLPEGFSLSNVEEVDPKGPGMQQMLKQAVYQVRSEIDIDKTVLAQRISDLMAKATFMQTRIRRKKEEAYDLRALLHDVELESYADGDAVFKMQVSAGQHGNLRPEAVLKALAFDDDGWHEIERIKLIFDT